MKNILTLLLCCCGVVFGQNYHIGDVYTAPDGSIGIIYYLHPDGSGGWVVALNDASTSCTWGDAVDVPGLANRTYTSYGVYQHFLNDTAGYTNTQVIRNYQNNNTYAAGIVDFDHGWVLPSLAQIRMLYSQLPFISSALIEAGGTDLSTGNYWSSAEQNASNAWAVYFNYGNFINKSKSTSCRVRAVRSFSYEETQPELSYSWSTGENTPDITVTPTQTTTYTVTVSTPGGCSDTVEHTIVVNSGYHTGMLVTWCDEYEWNGQVYTEDGDYDQTFTAANGCDSVVTLHLTVNHWTDSTLEVVVLDSGLPFILNGESYDSAGTYTQMLTNAAGCDSLLTIHLAVLPAVLPDNIDSADCTFLPEGTEWGIGNPIVSGMAASMCASVPLVGDIDDDGQQEIVMHTNSKVLVFNSDATLKNQFNIASSQQEGQLGLAKVQYGQGEYKTILVSYSTSNKYFYAYDNNGTLLWQSDHPFTSHNGEQYQMPAISFADFNHDGWTEMYAGAEIYDAATGVLLCKTNGNKGHAGRTWATNYSVYQSSAADLYGNYNLELVAGNTVYDVDIQSRTDASMNTMSPIRTLGAAVMTMSDGTAIPFSDGNTFLVDVNLDGRLDVLVMNVDQTNRVVYLYVWDVMSQSMICSKRIDNARKFGMPQIGDLDNDEFPEICFIVGTYNDHQPGNNETIYALKYNSQTQTEEMDVLWTTSHSDFSGATSLTLFDFNQDGYSELVYRDENHLRIINGSMHHHQTGEAVASPYDLATYACGSGTALEYPIVCDVDLDGAAEIIIGSSCVSSSHYGHLYIFKSSGEPWAPARKVWNQYMYNVTNVNEDLTIPQYQFNNATAFTDPEGVVRRPFNNFLQQATTIDQYGRPFYAVPDVAMETSASSQMQGDDTLALTFSYCNTGDNTLNAPYTITVFANAYGGEVVGTATINESLPVDSCTQGYIQLPISSLCGFQSLDNLVIAVNCAGAGIAQNGGQQPECDTTNNTATVVVTIHADTTHLTATVCDSYLWYGDTLTQSGTYTHTLTNASGCDSVVAVDLTISTPTDSTLEVVLLDSGLPFVLNGESYDSAGTYTQALTNAAGCDSLLTIHLAVLPTVLPDNIDSADCTVASLGHDWGIEKEWASAEMVSPLVIPLVGDIDSDGIPEIVCFAPNYSYMFDGVTQVMVFNSITHQVIHTFNLPNRISTFDAAPYGIVKLPNGHVIFVVVMRNQIMQAYDLTAMGTTPLWSVSVDGQAPNVGYADFNSDSYPEVYIGNSIYDAETGVLLASASAGSNYGRAMAHNGDVMLVSPCVANVVGDMKPDLILGNEIYEVVITNRSGLEGNSLTLAASITPPAGIANDGHPQVADFNLDGYLDVFISNKISKYGDVSFYVWDVHNGTLSNPVSIPTSENGKSIPLIANIDNDDNLEVVIQCRASSGNMVKTYKYDPESNSFSFIWDLYVDEDSYSNSMSAFDFNNDGQNDLLISDQTTVRIMNGSGRSHLTGNDTIPIYALTSLSFGECTVMQYPIVVDVDADGSAELLVLGRFGSGHTYQAYLNVFKSAGVPWAPARKVWNQYMYNVTNVNEDLTIPQYQFNNATAFTDPEGVVRRPFNNFLQQATTIDQYGRPFYAVPDVAMETSASSQMTGDTLALTFSYCNTGDNTLNAPYTITVFANAYGGEVVGTATINESLPVDSCAQGNIHLPSSTLCGFQSLDNLVVAVNCAGMGIAQNGGQQPECDTTNNTATVNVTLHADTTHLTASACDSYLWYGDTLTQSGEYTHTMTNATGCDSMVTLHLTIIPVPTLSYTPDTVIINGTSATLWASGADILYWTDGNDSILFSGNSLTVSPATATTYYLNGQNYNAVLEDNVVYNGDFEMGNAGFTSDYVYMANPSVLYEGEYYIGSNAHNCHPGFYNWNDHTTGSGNYMILNGAESPNTNVWTQTVTVTPNTDYAFSTWVCSVGGTPSIPTEQARLQFSVNGVQLGNIFTAPNAYGVWSRYYEVWNSGSDTSAVITILNQNTIAGGNDFGIDDIVFSPLTECSVTDSIRVAVIGYPDNVDSADCVFLPEGTEWGIGEPQISSTSVLTVTTPLVGDIDDDGQQEILIPSGDYKMYVFNADGTLKSQFSISGMYAGGPVGNVAIAKVRWENNLFKNIIVVFGSNKRLYAYDANGTLLWQSTQPFSNYNGEQHPLPTISFADFNHDGWTEIYVGSEIYDAATGVFLAKTEGNKGFAGRTWDVQANPYQTMAADLCGDYNLEVAIGNAVYTVDILSRTDASLNNMTAVRQVPSSLMVMEDNAAIPFTDGNTSLVDINKDGRLDVLVMNVDQSNRVVYCYVWDVETQSIICSKKIPNARKFGCPQIGDIDNDGNPEICFITGTYSNHNTGDNDLIYALKYNESNPSGEMDVFWTTPHGDDSGCTGLTLFDFNQDGYAELVYRDIARLRIINGSLHHHQTGETLTQPYDLASFQCVCSTQLEYPIVVDVDKDGEAEIIVGGGNAGTWTNYGHLYIFKSSGEPWAPARKVWNQYMYNVTNVNEDLTIPQYLFDNATVFTDPDGVVRRPFNNFLQQATTIDQYGRPFYAVPDVVVNSADLHDNGDSVMVTVNYCNTGDNTLNAPYSIAVFANAYGGDVVGTATMHENLPVDSCTQGSIQLSLGALCGIQSLDSLVVAVNCAGMGIAQNGGQQPECDTTNNTVAVAITMHTDTTHLTASACDSYIWYGDTLTQSGTYVHTLTNVTGCDSVEVLSLTIIPVPVLTHTPDTVILAGDSATLWATGADYLYWTDSNDSLLSNGNSLTVSPESTTTYYLQANNNVDSISCSTHETIRVVVSEYPDNVQDVDCVFPPDSNAFEMVELFQYPNVNSMSTPMVADMDGDGLPEIIACCNTGSAPWYSTNFHVLNGQTGALKYDISTVQYRNAGQMMTIADVDHDGKSELFLMGRDRKIYCYNYNGGVRWSSANTVDNNYLLSATDVNNDGEAEIVCGKYIYNAQTGALLLEGTMVETGMGFGAPHSVDSYHPPYYMYALGDVDGDGTPELCAGNTVYKMQIVNPSGTTGNSWSILRQATLPDSIINKDGETFIVDFDNDGDFDICVIGITHSLNNYTHSHTLDIYVWDGQTSQLIAHSPLTVNGEWGASIPYSGDLNGDGFPEIIFAVTEIGMLAYTYDTTTFSMSLMHNHAPFGETSGFTVFDFNQDGRNEIVYRGTHQLFIVDGVTLENLSEPITAYSGTVTEYPVVADVNADGHAEIIVTRAYGDWFTGSSANGWVSVYGSQIPGAWSSARKVWNQWAYNSVNINEDMTVPQHQFNISTTFPNGKKPFNSFLRQMPYIDSQGDLFNAVADVAVSGADAVVQNDTVLLSITYCNTGDNALFAPYNVAIFANAYGGDTVCTVTMNESLPVDSCNQGDIRLTISSLCSFQSLDSLVIAVNCAGTGIAQNGGQQPECDTTNNTAAVAISLHTDTTHLTASACDSYLWYGDTLTQSGTYTHTFTNVTGCDSVISLTVTVNQTSENTLSVIGVENNLPYIFNGISYSAPGTYYQHFTNAAGCDSTLVIQLTVNYNQTVEVDSTVCEVALPITWNDSVFVAAGTKTRIYPAANGADSIVVMNLHVNPNPTAVISGPAALCADSVATLTTDSAFSYSWSTGDTTRSINTSLPGVYALMVTNQYGCEAQTMHILTLLDNPILSVTVPEVCAGGSYTLSVGHQNTDNIHLAQGDTTLAPQAVTFQFDYSTADGLWLTTLSDSLFQINPPANLEHDTIIAYTFTVYDSIGCGYDTTVSITFRATRHTEMDTVVCVSFEWGDSVYTQSGQYVQHLTSAVGCDSVSTLNLTVNMPTDTTIAVTVLENNLPYVLNDSSYYDPGTYEQNLENALGCDSTITIDLTVLYNVTTNLDTTVCDNELPLLWNGFSCDSAGVYTSYQTSANGTDSTVYLTLTVNPTSENTLSVIGVENNLPYIFNGISYSVPGTYYQHFTNAAGCDSTLIIQLTVYYNQTVEVDSTICEDALPITWNDSVFEAAGTKTRIYPAANGADSIVVMTLHVNPNPTAVISGPTALCTDSLVTLIADSAYSYLWSNGDTTRIIYVSESGEYTLTVTNQYGCEATASHLSMPLNNPIISVTAPEMCAGGSYTLSVGHQNIDNIHLGQDDTTLTPQSVTFEFDYSTADGPWITTLSDSLFQINPPANLEHDTIIAYTFTVYDSAGCGYDTTVYITIKAARHTEFDTVVCDSFTWNDSVYTQSGQYVQYLLCENGCDSVVTCQLTVNHAVSGNETLNLVQNQLPYTVVPANTTFTMQSPLVSNISYTLTSAAGCDSLVNLTVYIYHNVAHQVDTTVCASALPFTWHGHTFTAAGNHTVTLLTSHGADSVVTYHLSVINLSANVGNVTHITCYGSSTGAATATVTGGQAPMTYAWTNASGANVSTTTSISNRPAGTYTFTVTDHLGCTATTTVTLNTLNGELAPGTIAADQQVCDGANAEPFTGTAASGGDNGAYQWQISTNGTDWTPAPGTTNAQNYTYPNPVSNDFSLRRAWVSQTCGTVYSNTVTVTFWPNSLDTITAEICLGYPYQENGFNITPDQTDQVGEYTFEQHYSSGFCDSAVVLLLTVNPLGATTIEDEVCEGAGYSGQGFWISPMETVGVDSVSKTVNLQNVYGCDSVVTLRLSVIDTGLRVVSLTTDFCEDQSAELMVVTDMTNYVWSTGETAPTILVTAPGHYTVEAYQGECHNTAYFNVAGCPTEFQLPNTITPSNGDGLNDYFYIPESYQKDMALFEIAIFNRWGEMVFYSTNKNFQWNGEYRGDIQYQTIYNYIINYSDQAGRPHRVTGSITVL